MPEGNGRRLFLKHASTWGISALGLSTQPGCSSAPSYPADAGDEQCNEAPEDQLDVGLALSGGGYRAMLFDLGSLWCLNDFGLLRRLDMIASVSGGSIVNGLLATRWQDLTWTQTGLGWRATNFREEVADPIIRFAGETIDVPSVLARILFGTASVQIARHYDHHLYHGRTLRNDVPPFEKGRTPRFLFYATNLQTGSSVRMERKRLADFRIGEVEDPDLPMSLVVAASSAFPPFLSPVKLQFDESRWSRTCGAYLYPHAELRRELIVTDGGVYDNMATEVIWDRCKTVLVSDAGAPLDATANPSPLWIPQLVRILDIESEQTRALRRRRLLQDFRAHEANPQNGRAGTYWGIKTRIDSYQVADPLVRDNSVTLGLQDIPTRLGGFTREQQGRLVNWGYALADAGIRRWVFKDASRPAALPVPEFAL